LFIGTQFSNLYTAVDTPAKAAWLCVWCLCVSMCTVCGPAPSSNLQAKRLQTRRAATREVLPGKLQCGVSYFLAAVHAPSQRQAPAFKFFKLEPAAKLSGSSLSLSSYIPFYFSQNLSSLPSSSKLPFSRRIAAVLPFKLQTSSSGSSESTSYFQ
jgi:hypothetical protein